MQSYKSPLEPNSHSSTGTGTPRELQRLDRGSPAIRRLRPLPDADLKPSPGMKYWPVLWRSKWMILAGGVLAFVLGFVSTLPQKPVYQAKTTLELEGLNENFLNFKNVDETERPSSDVASLQTQIKILQSRTLLLRVIAKLRLENRPEFVGQDPASSRPLQGSQDAQGTPTTASTEARREQALWAVAARLGVRGSGQTHIIEVLFDSTDPKLAASVANTLVNEFIEQNIESRWKEGEQTANFLTGQLNDLKVKLEKSEDDLQAYARSTGVIFNGGGVSSSSSDSDKQGMSVSEERLRDIQSELTKAQADRAIKQADYEQAKTSSPEALADVLNDSVLRDYQIKIEELRRQYAELNAILTPAHPKVQRVQAQIAELEPAIEQARRDVMEKVANSYRAALLREDILQKEYSAQTQVVSEEAEKNVHYDILKKEVESNRQLYESMLQHVKEAGIAAAQRASPIRVVDPAPEPTAPYKPRPMQTGLLAALSGFALTSALVLMRERADRSLQAPGDAARYLNVAELGVIPSTKTNFSGRLIYDAGPPAKSNRLRPGLAGRNAANGSVKPTPANIGVGAPLELVQRGNKPSPLFDEAFQTTVTSILLSGLSESHSRVFVLTSPNPSEGKTTVATNLAIAFAQVNQNVLLIDGDMRRPRIHNIFGAGNDLGLSLLLAGSSLSKENCLSAVLPTNIKGLSILTSGPTSMVSAHNLLYSSRTAELLHYYREEYDIVLIDSPPMLHMSDARVLAKFSDAVILVLRLGRTTRDEALTAQKRFADDGHPVLGVVMNDWHPKDKSTYSTYKRYADAYAKPPLSTKPEPLDA